jgi:hypothetical protein
MKQLKTHQLVYREYEHTHVADRLADAEKALKEHDFSNKSMASVQLAEILGAKVRHCRELLRTLDKRVERLKT